MVCFALQARLSGRRAKGTGGDWEVGVGEGFPVTFFGDRCDGEMRVVKGVF